MEARTVERFKMRTVWLHWIHTVAFLVLIITGAILFVPGIGEAAAGGATRIIHRVFVILFVIPPLLYIPTNPKECILFVKESFSVGASDIGWFMVAPDYYFGGQEERMPPQGHANMGQKMWQIVVMGTGAIFVVTGALMWFGRDTVPPEVFQWSLLLHGLAFFAAFLMLLVHVYLGALHPRMTESFRSILDGKISVHYAKSHYGRWYKEMKSGKKKH